MKPAWQIVTTETFNLGWDSMVLLGGREGTPAKLIYVDVALNDHSDRRDIEVLATL
jgi:hypothetical protein